MSVSTSVPRITGVVYPRDYFKIGEFTRLDPVEIVRVMRGEVAGCIFRGVMDPKLCQRICDNFWKSPHLRQRGDAVPAYYIGTYHYAKELDVYFREAADTAAALHEVFDGGRNVFADLMTALRGELARDQVGVRVAANNGRAAGEFVVRSWSAAGQFSLAAHDDAAQLTAKRQRGFEIQELGGAALTAVNMCLQNGSGGNLVYWNIEPDVATRRQLGIEETGYPYQAEWLNDFDRIDLPIHAGDIYFFNGKLIHAVQAQAEPGVYRTTVSFLMGFKDPKTVIYWT